MSATKTNRDIISQVNELKELLESYREEYTLLTNIAFSRIKDIEPPELLVGCSFSAFRSWIDKLEKLQSECEANPDKKFSKEKMLKTIKKGARKFEVRILSKYRKTNKSEFSPSTLSFSENALFEVIFPYVNEYESSELMLGRAVLKIRNYIDVTFENIEDNISKTYNGERSFFGNTQFFNLISDDGTMHLSIKTYFYSKSDKIFLGSFETYENDTLVHGNLILKKSKEMDLEPSFMSYKKSRKEFLQLESPIKDYLRFRRHSYVRVPKSLKNIQNLEDFLALDRVKKPLKRFVEYDIPRVFIAAPSSSVSTQDFNSFKLGLENLMARLNNEFAPKVEIDEFNEQYKMEWEVDVTSPPSLKVLPTTRIFVLIYDHKQSLNASLSLIQVGLAMQFCKEVIIFHSEDSLSDNILRLEKEGVKFHKYETIDYLTFDKIFLSLKKEIHSSLKDYLLLDM